MASPGRGRNVAKKKPAELARRRAWIQRLVRLTTVERRDQVVQAAEQRRPEAFDFEIARGHLWNVAQVQTDFFLATRRGEIMGSRDRRGLTNRSVSLRVRMSLRLGSSRRRGRGIATNLVVGGAGCAHQILHKPTRQWTCEKLGYTRASSAPGV